MTLSIRYSADRHRLSLPRPVRHRQPRLVEGKVRRAVSRARREGEPAG